MNVTLRVVYLNDGCVVLIVVLHYNDDVFEYHHHPNTTKLK